MFAATALSLTLIAHGFAAAHSRYGKKRWNQMFQRRRQRR